MKRLDAEVGALAARAAPGLLGFGLMNLESGEFWVRLDDRRFPMAAVFMLPLAAAALAEVDAGRLALAETLMLTDEALSPPHSPIAEAWPAHTAYSAGDLLAAAVIDSDNTAADLLMKRIGGPGAVEAWLQLKSIDEVRVDRYERDLQPAVYGMASFRPAWKGEAAFAAAKATVAPQSRLGAARAYMADPRDSATPRGMLGFLRRLNDGELLSPASTRVLLGLMARARWGADGFKAGLPKGVSFAHRPGASDPDQGLTAAYNDIGVFTLPDRRSYAVALFLAGSTAPERDRAALFADLGRVAIRSVR